MWQLMWHMGCCHGKDDMAQRLRVNLVSHIFSQFYHNFVTWRLMIDVNKIDPYESMISPLVSHHIAKLW